MFLKLLLILLISALIVSCARRQEEPLNEIRHNIVTMQDIANQMNFDPDDEAWLDMYENIGVVEDPVVNEPPPVAQVATPAPVVQATPRPEPTRPAQTPPAQQRPAQTTNVRPTTAPREVEHGEFTASLMSLRNRERVEEIRRTLAAASYFTEIQEVEINGETWFRLRLAGSFSRSYAEYLAQKIQSEFREITGYWVMRR